MAGHRNRNDSSQMKDLMQFEDLEKNENKKPKPERQQSSDGSTEPASRSSHSRSELRPPEDAGRGSRQEETRMKMQSGGGALSCCGLDELKRLPQCDIKLGRLTFSKFHIVLIDVRLFHNGAGPFPVDGKDLWQRGFVKMPCSPANTIYSSKPNLQMGSLKFKGFNGPSQVSRWNLISKLLKGLASKKAVSVSEVEKTILEYNPKYKGQWSFDALSTFVKHVPKVENYFDTLFPKIAALALKLPEEVKKAIPLLQKNQQTAITLSQVQISCLLANAFYCTFPHRNSSGPDAEYHSYPSINFNKLFGNWSERKKEKLRAIMHYFNVVTDEKTKLDGLVTFERRCLRDSPTWRHCTEKLQKLHVTSEGSIEAEGTGLLQVDFASSWIGGGVLDSGLVQEEILFLINPELIVSRLFTEKLGDTECLVVTGLQQFSCYSGFSDSFEWAGPYKDDLERDEWSRLKRQIVAIDALHFKHRSDQYSMVKINRELNKAYCGFKEQHEQKEPDIATGKWGCGAFKGDPKLKAIIQLMAAAKARRGLAFFTFKDEELKTELQEIYHLLVTEKKRVGQLYELLEDYCADWRTSRGSCVDLFEFLRRTIRRSKSQL